MYIVKRCKVRSWSQGNKSLITVRLVTGENVLFLRSIEHPNLNQPRKFQRKFCIRMDLSCTWFDQIQVLEPRVIRIHRPRIPTRSDPTTNLSTWSFTRFPTVATIELSRPFFRSVFCYSNFFTRGMSSSLSPNANDEENVRRNRILSSKLYFDVPSSMVLE